MTWVSKYEYLISGLSSFISLDFVKAYRKNSDGQLPDFYAILHVISIFPALNRGVMYNKHNSFPSY